MVGSSVLPNTSCVVVFTLTVNLLTIVVILIEFFSSAL